MVAPLATAPAPEMDEELEDASSPGSATELDSFLPIPLAHYDETGFALTGIIALRGAPGTYMGDAVRLGAELSRSLREASASARSTPP